MDLKVSLVNTCLKIYPSEHFTTFLKTLSEEENIPSNISKLIGKNSKGKLNEEVPKPSIVHLSSADIKKIEEITDYVKLKTVVTKSDECEPNNTVKQNGSNEEKSDDDKETHKEKSRKEKLGDTPEKQATKDSTEKEFSDNEDDSKEKEIVQKDSKPFLTTSDIDWLYSYLHKRRSNGDDVPYLHSLLEGANIDVPENKTMKRNPQLEARCVKLRAQQQAREYRKMTKTVDNVRLKFPEDSIAYQMKQMNRQLIAVGQFLISIFAGFLFGFRGVEWMVGNLDFGFRLLLGVMCALIIALAEIYFLAKKLNEELNIPETVQLGGPVKFADEHNYRHLPTKVKEKEHQD